MNGAFARYSRLMLVLHWTTAALVVAAYLHSEGGRHVREHPPPLQEYGSRWLTAAARTSHTLLYLLLLAVPILGWYVASRLGVPAWLFGITLPPLTAAVPGPAGLFGQVHQIGGNLILILAGIHALAALWHHFGLRDNTLRRMSPF